MRFSQSTGRMFLDSGIFVCTAYAGHGEGKNNPVLQAIHGGCRWENGAWVPAMGLGPDDWGPLPCGLYTLNAPEDTPKHGPYVLWLTPDSRNEMFGRSGFGWHGDSTEHPGLASEGCICSAKVFRVQAWTMKQKIQVVP